MRLLLLTTLLSVPALAKATQPYLNTWSVDSENWAYVYSEDDAAGAVHGGENLILFVKEKENCNPSTHNDRDAVMPVNGQPVSMKVVCGEETKKELFIAQNDAGRQFVFNEFVMKETVEIGQFKFSARGFQAALKQVENNNSNVL